MAAGTVVVDQQVFQVSTAIVGNVSLPPPSGYSQKTFGAGFYEVEVDPATGEVRVLDVVQVHDAGTIINPLGRREPGPRGHLPRDEQGADGGGDLRIAPTGRAGQYQPG
ncbi:MAG: hypothetical protein KatS3mg061_1067 [Dehalococcoidia bacterium]|nr:MAG: hypothetical protein KatS3mg061_1067 [Dehalococcoidia bacterium]